MNQTMSKDAVTLEIINDNIALVTMQDKKNKNMFSLDLYMGLIRIFTEINNNSDIKVVVLTGYEDIFCMGGTKEQLLQLSNKDRTYKDLAFLYKGLLSCNVPVIAAMSGNAVGGGLVFGLYADIIIMSNDSVYSANFMKYGFTPGLGSTFVLKEKLGINLATEMMFTAEFFKGYELKNRGCSLIFKPKAEVLNEALLIAKQLCEKTFYSLNILKKGLSGKFLQSLTDALDLEFEMHESTISHPEAKNRIYASTFDTTNSCENYSRSEGYSNDNIIQNINNNITSDGTSSKIKLKPKSNDHMEVLEKTINSNLPNENIFFNLQNKKEYKSINNSSNCLNNNLKETNIPQIDTTSINSNSCIDKTVPPEICSIIKSIISDVLHLQTTEINPDDSLLDLGMDSINAVEIVISISNEFNIDMKVIELYDYTCISKLTDYVSSKIQSQPHIENTLEDSSNFNNLDSSNSNPQNTYSNYDNTPITDTDIAIIGISGRFPGADNIVQFWENLKNGVNSVTEISRNRWNISDFYSSDPSTPNKSYCKHLGQLSNIDEFDPLFFSIPPKEAEFLDPQQRLFLEEAWKAIEDSGYTKDRLSFEKCGIFVGSLQSDFKELIKSSSKNISINLITGTDNSFIPARVAYFLDFTGPNICIDTACSSSLVSVHQACQSIMNNESEIALAGGTCILLTPDLHISASKGEILSKEGKCRPFDNDADGFVPAEGICAIVLKPLKKAIKDNDNIYAVIKGSSINQDGKSNGITAPSSFSQTELETDVYKKFNINPEEIGYIECHGTGTKLGDPIEIAALNNAFSQFTKNKQFCAIGSVKSNIGHSLAASGIIGLIKVLLCLKNRKLVPSINFDTENEHINLKDSPFYVNTQYRDWPNLNNKPRKAAISSFGLSGTNCHMVVEEYVHQTSNYVEGPYIFILSAKDNSILKKYSKNLATFLESHKVSLYDAAYTLQVGRSEMEERLAIIASNSDELILGLQSYCADKWSNNVFSGNTRKSAKKDDITTTNIESSDLISLANSWISGSKIDWKLLYKNNLPRKVSLPTYPFAKESYWLETTNDCSSSQISYQHPNCVNSILDIQTKKLYGNLGFDSCTPSIYSYHLNKVFEITSFYIKDHIVNNKYVLPGVVHLEMAVSAGELANNHQAVTKLKNIVWLKPIVFEENSQDISIQLHNNENCITYKIGDNYSQGEICYNTKSNDELISPNNIILRCPNSKNSSECYNLFSTNGVTFGDSFKTIKEFYYNDIEAISYLELPKSLEGSFDQFILHPSLIDGALQTSLALFYKGGAQYLPFSVEEVEILKPLTKSCYAYVKQNGNSFNIIISDLNGLVLIKLKNFSIREVKSPNNNKDKVKYYTTQWENSDVSPIEATNQNILLFDTDNFLYEKINSNNRTILVNIGESFKQLGENIFQINPENPENYQDLLKTLLNTGFIPKNIVYMWSKKITLPIYPLLYLSKSLSEHISTDYIKFLHIFNVNEEINHALNSAISGFFKTLRKENPMFVCKTVAIKENAQLNIDKILLKELELEGCMEVFYKEGSRLIKQLSEIDIKKDHKSVVIKDSGTYIITGGAGGLGLLFAKHIALKAKCNIVLTGRSDLTFEKQQKIQEIRDLGSEVIYIKADITNKISVNMLISATKSKFHKIDGLIHSAASIRDTYLIKKTKNDISTVISPKISGLLYLDEALNKDELDFWVLFSSLASEFGNLGQLDYSYANSFMDNFVLNNFHKFKKVLSISWPLWEDGGLKLSSEFENQFKKTFGMSTLKSDDGITAFFNLLDQDSGHYLVVCGNEDQLKKSITYEHHNLYYKLPKQQVTITDDTSKLFQETSHYLKTLISNVLKIPQNKLHNDVSFEEYGIDSLVMMDLTNELEKDFSNLPKTLFFQYKNIEELTNYFIKKKQPLISSVLYSEDISPLENKSEVVSNEYYETTSVQKRLFAIQQVDPDNICYNLPFYLTIHGDLGKDKIENIINALIERHTSFRTSFNIINGQLKQVIHSYSKINLKFIESDILSDDLIKDFIKPFDLTIAPLLRCMLVKLKDNKFTLILDFHHIIFDGMSAVIFLKELKMLFSNKELPPIEMNYADFTEWQNKLLVSKELKIQEEYWLNKYKGILPQLSLPFDYPRPTSKSFEGNSIVFEIDKTLVDKLYKMTLKTGTTLYMIMIAAYNILLYKYTGQNDIIIGSPIAGRSHTGLDKLIGMFVNTLALRFYIDDRKSFIEFLSQAKQNIMEAIENQDYQFADLVDKLQIKDNFKNPLFDTMFVMENINLPDQLEIAGFKVIPELLINKGSSMFYLTLQVVELPSTIKFCIEYSTKLFTHNKIKNLGVHYINVLNEIVNNSSTPISQLKILSDEETQSLLYKFNSNNLVIESQTISKMFEHQVYTTPLNIAVEYLDKKLTYSELNNLANNLAKDLVNEGIQKNDIVAIFLPRSIDMIIGILAILKAGGAYLPLDIEYPQARIDYILKDSTPKIILTESCLASNIKFEGKKIYIDHYSECNHPSENLDIASSPNDLAYVIYTSGSTGTPKGVMVEHQGFTSLKACFENQFNINESDKILQFSSSSFDASVWEIFMALLTGATLSIIPKEEILDLTKFEHYLDRFNISVATLPPAYLSRLKNNSSLRLLISAGSEPNIQDVKFWSEKIKFVNAYGPTETTICATSYEVKSTENLSKVPIGKPIANKKIYILDNNNNPVPVGIVGELCVSGAGIARGYLNKPDLTSKKFISNPFSPGEILYKTGDIAKWLSDGNIEFIGRRDNMVKVRGYRIELNEIEQCILNYDHIKESLVILNENEDLIAYFVSTLDIQTDELKNHVLTHLPKYMLPTYFIHLDKFTLNLSGKIDKNNLPKPNALSLNDSYEAPTNEIQEKLAILWQTILHQNKIGINDNFFDIGGNSLKAMEFLAKLQKEFSIELQMKEFFKNPTIKLISRSISDSPNIDFPQIYKVPDSKYYDLSSAQKRLFILNSIDKISISYNIPIAIKIEGNLDINRIKKAFDNLISRHLAFKTSFEVIDGEPKQKINNSTAFNIEYLELLNKDVNEMLEQLIKPFDLSQSPIFRVKIIKVVDLPDVHILFIDIHHIIFDGVSLIILFNDLANYLNNMVLPNLDIRYIDFANWHNSYLKSSYIQNQKKYWLNLFSEEIPLLDLPLDYQRPHIQSFEGDSIEFKIDKNLTQKIISLSKENDCTLFMFLLSAYTTLLHRYTNQNDIIVGTPIAGRNHDSSQNIIGMFVNTLALRNYPEQSKTFLEFLSEVKVNAINAFQNQNVQFEDLVDTLNLKRDVARNPLFDTMFILQNMDYQEMSVEDLKLTPYKIKNHTSKFDITLEAREYNAEINFSIEYSSKLFKKETIVKMINHFINLLKSISENPNLKLGEFNILTNQERNQLLYEFNNTTLDYPYHKTVQELFEEQVKKTPHNIVLEYQGQNITYIQLNLYANSLAKLLTYKGISSNSVIGIMTERSINCIIAIVAVLKAGGTVLPIDPTYPKERINHILMDSKANLLITETIYKQYVELDIQLVFLEELYLFNDTQPNPPIACSSSDNLYIIYTSGTTGHPKGVLMKHQNLVNLISFQLEKTNIDFGKRVLGFTTFCFDVFFQELFSTLLSGGTLCIINENQKKDVYELLDFIKKNNINILFLPTGYLNSLASEEHCLNSFPDSVEHIITAGEQLVISPIFKDHLIKTQNNSSLFLHNHYGPSETHVATTYTIGTEKEIPDFPPIGKPISNTKIYILNMSNKLQPIGIPGELYISGDCVGNGYINSKELTAQRFLLDHYSNKPMYKTGDVAKWLPDGNIEFIGRADSQIKIRGYRVELSEIETQILKFGGIKEAKTIVRETNGNKYILAYFVSNKTIDTKSLQNFIKHTLPHYMMPNKFIQLPQIPLTKNGKINKKALPTPNELDVDLKPFVAPQNKVEKILVEIWSKILGIKKVSIDDNFFELGGDSLLIIKIQTALFKYNWNLSTQDFFINQTIRELAKKINTQLNSNIITINQLEIVQYPKNIKSLSFSGEKLKFKNIFLTGVTGFLGVHILNELLTQTDTKVYCLIRAENIDKAKNRLFKLFDFYLFENYKSLIGSRINIILGDITLNNFGLSDYNYNYLGEKIDSIIHSAALVKHYGNYNEFYNVNVAGISNIIEFASRFNIKLNHISTIGISGRYFQSGERTDNHIFTEDDFYIGQNFSENIYIQSKFEAENLVFKAINDGLSATIFRIGNLIGRYSDGIFQINQDENAFYRTMKSVIKLANIPESLSNIDLELTPVDFCSNALVKMFDKPESLGQAFHLFNINKIKMFELLEYYKILNININVMDNNEFKEFLTFISNDEGKQDHLTGLINDFDKNKDLIYNFPISVCGKKTTNYLKHFNFKWPKPNVEYISKLMKHIVLHD